MSADDVIIILKTMFQIEIEDLGNSYVDDDFYAGIKEGLEQSTRMLNKVEKLINTRN